MGEGGESLRFVMESSEGEESYTVRAWRSGGDLLMTCNCMAAVTRNHCRHRIELLNGLVTGLVEPQDGDMARLAELLADTPLAAALREHGQSERAAQSAELALRHATRRLTELLNLGFAADPAQAPTRAGKRRRTEQVEIAFAGPHRCAEGWAFDVPDCFREALDIRLSEFTETNVGPDGPPQGEGFRSSRRKAWTRGVPPKLSFERGQVFHELHPAHRLDEHRQLAWGEALQRLARIVQIVDARPERGDALGGSLTFKLWEVVAGELGQDQLHRCTPAQFCEFLRTGDLPERR